MNIFERFYNTAALMIRMILEHTDEKFFERYSALGKSAREKINKCLTESFPELFADKQSIEILASACYDDDFFKRLNDFYNGKDSEYKLQCTVCLLSKLDISLSKRSEYFKSGGALQGLNTNIMETHIQFLPRCHCSWEHKSRGSSHANDLSNYLQYYFYIDLDDMKGYEVWHHFLDPDTFAKARTRKYLLIGISPLSNQCKLLWTPEERNGVQYFSVTGLENEAEVNENMLSLLEEARRQQVDILCFPEMLGSQRLYVQAAAKLSQFPADNQFYPPLTVLPSLWEKHHNTAVVLDDLGDEIMRQEKQHGFLFPDEKSGEKYLEDIQPKRQIHLIHCQGIGRMAVLICKDALITEYLLMILRSLKVTLLLIPSFSTGNYDFQEVIECCKVADCCAFWINTCSVQQLAFVDKEKFDVIGLTLKAGKQCPSIRNGTYPCNRSKQGCFKTDIGDCSHCLYVQKIQF